MRDSGGPAIGTLAAGVAHTLETRIRQGLLPSGRALPSERELATEFQVSRGIIRSALEELAKTGLLHQRPRHRPVVRNLPVLVTPGMRNLGAWLWPNSSHSSAASILKGVQSTNLGPSTQVIVASGAGDNWSSVLDSERDFLESMADDPATMGVIIWYLGGERNLPSLQKLQNRKVPIVCVDRLPPAGFDVDYVGTNNSDSAMQGVQHLIDLGHRKIGLISNIDPASSVADREEGYRRALADAGIEFQDDWIQRVTYDAVASVASAVEFLLQLPDRPTAVFCINDQLGLQVYDILGRMGISIPDEFSIVGFDGLLSWLPGGSYLTTMRQEFERFGRIAATLLYEKTEGLAPAANRHYLLDAPLALGLSSGPPNANPKFVRNAAGLRNPHFVEGDIS